MTVLSSLGLMAGVFLLMPKVYLVTAVLWGVAKVPVGRPDEDAA